MILKIISEAYFKDDEFWGGGGGRVTIRGCLRIDNMRCTNCAYDGLRNV